MSDPTVQAPAILFVDDEANAVKYFERAIGALAPVVVAGSVEEGKKVLDAHAGTLAVLVSDQRMPGEYGNELLRYARERYPQIVRILTTAYSEIEETVEAINQGQIHRYIKKPWDITSLRMEMKQAVELANLRKERDELVREKITVGKKQLLMGRIGTVRTLSLALAAQESFQPVETYLAAAAAAGLSAAEPDWSMMDYADLIDKESARSGAFGQAARHALDSLRQGSAPSGNPLERLAALLPGKVTVTPSGAATIGDATVLTAFLDGSPTVAAPTEGAGWLAFLVWLDAHGQAVRVGKTDQGLECALTQPDLKPAGDRLAGWAERL